MLGLTQNHDQTNRKGRKGHKGIRVSESSCVSPGCIQNLSPLTFNDADNRIAAVTFKGSM